MSGINMIKYSEPLSSLVNSQCWCCPGTCFFFFFFFFFFFVFFFFVGQDSCIKGDFHEIQNFILRIEYSQQGIEGGGGGGQMEGFYDS